MPFSLYNDCTNHGSSVFDRRLPLPLGGCEGAANDVLGHTYSHGSLCNLREFVRRVQVDKSGKVFNVCDEFILHAFRKSHLLAAVCTHLKVQSPDTSITHEGNLQWLETTAEAIVTQNIYPATSSDTVYGLHRSILHTYGISLYGPLECLSL